MNCHFCLDIALPFCELKILIKSGGRQYKVAPLYKNWETSASLSVNSMHKSFTKENLTLVLQNTCNGFYWLFKFTCILEY